VSKKVNAPLQSVLWIVTGIGTSILSYWLARDYLLPMSLTAFEYLSPGTVITSLGVFLLLTHYLRKVNGLKSKKITTYVYHLSSVSLGVLFLHQFILEAANRYIPLFRTEFFLDGIIKGLILFAVSVFILLVLTRAIYVRKIVT
jgi:hypothetical protein